MPETGYPGRKSLDVPTTDWVTQEVIEQVVEHQNGPDPHAQYVTWDELNDLELQLAYIFSQGTAAATWIINHPLRYQPNVTVIDSAGTTVEGDVEYTSNTQITLRFSAPFSGKAYLS